MSRSPKPKRPSRKRTSAKRYREPSSTCRRRVSEIHRNMTSNRQVAAAVFLGAKTAWRLAAEWGIPEEMAQAFLVRAVQAGYVQATVDMGLVAACPDQEILA
ncbi:MAG: hypothetical protein V4636_13100 [Pseudomonadota bacterium]